MQALIRCCTNSPCCAEHAVLRDSPVLADPPPPTSSEGGGCGWLGGGTRCKMRLFRWGPDFTGLHLRALGSHGEIFMRGESDQMCNFIAITGYSAKLQFSAPFFVQMMTTMMIIIANTDNGPSSAPSFLSSNSFKTHARPTGVIPLFSHFTD